VLTFAAAGFLFHDCIVWLAASSLGYRYTFPLVTVAFVLLGLLVLASDRFGLTLQALPVLARVIVHGGAIVCAFALALSAALLFNGLGA
jgi:hypothetical protein